MNIKNFGKNFIPGQKNSGQRVSQHILRIFVNFQATSLIKIFHIKNNMYSYSLDVTKLRTKSITRFYWIES